MRNIGKNLKDTKGITLVALVVTIIVLLILAGISLSMVLNQDGIFSRAEQATDKYGQAKARETLELALGEAQMQKYEEGLSEEQLDNKIAQIEGELLPKEKPEYPELQNVIVDGYIFEIDRSVPKIVDYIGPADGIVITAYVTGNDSWVRLDETVKVKGSIKKYGGGTIVSSSAMATNGVTIPTDFPTVGGSFTIPNISVDTDITITATDSDNKTVTKTIAVRIKRDGTAPTVESIIAKAEGLVIKFTATGHDKNLEGQEESGIDYFTYTITSTQDTALEGIPADKITGKFTQGQTVEIKTTPTEDREETMYTIKVTATDNCNNTTLDIYSKTENVIAIDGITVADVKKITKDTIQENLGKQVIDYTPPAGGKWRIFYREDSSNYFGDGEGTIYLKRDYDGNPLVTLTDYKDYNSSNYGISIMKKMNPKWRDYPTKNENIVNLSNEKAISWLYDSKNWINYKVNEVSDYVIGSSSIELFMKSYNMWNKINLDYQELQCKVDNQYGYLISLNGDYGLRGGWDTFPYEMKSGPYNLYVNQDAYTIMLSSPCYKIDSLFHYGGNYISGTTYTSPYGLEPIAVILK